MTQPLKYSVEIEAEKVHSDIIPTLAILEELKSRNPKIFKIAIEAIQEMEKLS